ncbi:NAD-dependent epimerase/dehydratase family protein [Streptomyces sp. NPDC048297]|uniref:NAD-dependent epimerase/dehydratase family protein n=1 Tax=Streptomyces sp. NPDC048297 TaxID=3365531 RepID=UPI003714DECA
MSDSPPPASPTWDTARILATYSELLSTEVTLDADFFMMGGHSLMAVILADRLREQLGVPVTGLEVMDHATPRALIAALRGRAAETQPQPQTEAESGASGPASADLRTVLVTGGSGGVGSFVVRELLARGHRVRVLARPESASVVNSTGAEAVEGDLTRPDSLRGLLREGVDAVVHAACTFTEPDVDVAAMRALADGWGGGPFVFVSSVDAYGTPSHHDVREGQATEGAVSDYGRGKADCERVLFAAADRHGIRDQLSVVRVPLVWGPHRRLRDQLRWGALGKLYQWGVRGEPILLPEAAGTAHPWSGVPWVGAAALARGLAAMLDRPAGGIVNTVGGHVGWAEFATELVTLLGSESVVRHSSSAEPGLNRPWQYRSEVFDARYGLDLREDWRPLLAATLDATDRAPVA